MPTLYAGTEVATVAVVERSVASVRRVGKNAMGSAGITVAT